MPMDRRRFVALGTGAAVGAHLGSCLGSPVRSAQAPLAVPDYAAVTIDGGIPLAQQRNALSILNGFSDDSLLKPFREMGGMPAPGADLGGWYQYLPTYDWHTGDAGLAPGHAFGQWTSAMARFARASADAQLAARALLLQTRFSECITPIPHATRPTRWTS